MLYNYVLKVLCPFTRTDAYIYVCSIVIISQYYVMPYIVCLANMPDASRIRHMRMCLSS